MKSQETKKVRPLEDEDEIEYDTVGQYKKGSFDDEDDSYLEEDDWLLEDE